MSNEEHHTRIKKLLERNGKGKRYGPKIFDYMLTLTAGKPKHEIAAHFNTLADSHGFFYGFQALKKMKLVEPAGVANKLTSASAGNNKRKEHDDGKQQDDAADSCAVDGDIKDYTDTINDQEATATKKVYNSKKKREGGQMWRLTDKAFLKGQQPG
jgi:hypothetical protein